MNSKHKLKRIKWGTIITAICLISFILLNTSAKGLNSAKVKKVADKNKCTIYKVDDFKPKITSEEVNNQIKLNISLENNKKARFWLFISRGIDMDGGIDIEEINDISMSTDYTKNYSLVGLPLEEFYVIMVYKDGIDGSCGTTTQETATEIAKDYISNHGKFSEAKETEIKKNSYIAIGNLELIEVSSDEAMTQIDDDGESDTEKRANEVEKESNETTASEYDAHGTTGSEKTNNTNLGDLYCNVNHLYKEGETSGDNYYTNNKSYYHEETTETTTCKTTCKETITVQYGPPVAIKAGMCFEYKVKVKSKVSCKATYTGPSKPTKPALCSIKPSCNNLTKYFDQAGPDDEFDTCINTCDGGKYSQKCINSCYKKVYDNTNTKKISYENIEKTAEVKFMSDKFTTNSINLDTSSKFCSGNNNPKSYSENYTNLVTAMKNNRECEYKYDNKNRNIYWSCSTSKKSGQSSTNWSSLGKYYFLTDAKATQTIQSIATSCEGEPGRAKLYHYYIDNNGFKRACFSAEKNNNNINCDKHCTESCAWQVAEGNIIMDGGESGNCYVSKTKRNEDYEKALKDYIAAKDACKLKAKCSESQAEFIISANNSVEGTDNTSTFAATSTDSKTFTVTNTLSPIIDSGGCYGSKQGNYNYMAEWSFPGSWRNNKNGTISQTKPSNTKGWSQVKNYFCTSLKSDSVNSTWWNWAQNTKLANKTSYNTESYPGSKNIDYNIKARTKDFGHFNWQLNINCFYAIPSAIPCKGDDCDPGAELDYQARSVDTEDLFPSSSRDPENTGNKNIGFNWTEAANENIGDRKYEIQPAELLKNIQENNTYDNNKLEYYFKLGRTQLNKLKKAKTNMTDFDGKFEKIENIGKSSIKTYSIWRYKSNIIRNSDYVGTYKINRNIFCNNWVDSSTCKTY